MGDAACKLLRRYYFETHQKIFNKYDFFSNVLTDFSISFKQKTFSLRYINSWGRDGYAIKTDFFAYNGIDE